MNKTATTVALSFCIIFCGLCEFDEVWLPLAIGKVSN